ncbi:hypothetical protein OVY01_13830 [Robbsia sp. Bb-Pol-6]|uniref:Uncharacterized protein n=1 Tax=Robbsia betulipollinis TaxID=2981849 RepID=A0ABT3ZP25_9BURK|nr:hypothetical protein [Robbsia betulipollinis]MCY0388296.1 hypothetical protein [Robbsia betulipollinis]
MEESVQTPPRQNQIDSVQRAPASQVHIQVLHKAGIQAILVLFASFWIRPIGRFDAAQPCVFGFSEDFGGRESIKAMVVLQLSPAVHAQTADKLTGPRLTDCAMVALPD